MLVALLFAGIRALYGTNLDPATFDAERLDYIRRCFEASGWTIVLRHGHNTPLLERLMIVDVTREHRDALP
jgi:hypothetical protein